MCPCCKSLRAMREAVKHPSFTSITAAKQANQAFAGDRVVSSAEEIAKCPTHGSTEALEGFWDEYDQLVAEINGAARDRVMRVLFGQRWRPAPAPAADKEVV